MQHHQAMPETDPTGDVQVFATTFTALNNSGVAGRALLALDLGQGTLTVDIRARGLEPDQMHIQHIHGFTDGTDAQSPTTLQDTDHDGYVELGEGAVQYGPILLNLSLDPADSAHDHGTAGHDHTANAMFPTADAHGRIHYQEVFHFDPTDANAQAVLDSLLPLGAKEVVLHGLSAPEGAGMGTDGEIDGSAGYKLVLPVASGELHELHHGARFAQAMHIHDSLGTELPAAAHSTDWYM